MKRNKKVYDDDDGRTIVSMDGVGTPWHERFREVSDRRTQEERERKRQEGEEVLTVDERKEYRKDTRAIIRGILLRMLPFIFGFVAVFGIAILIMWYLWK